MLNLMLGVNLQWTSSPFRRLKLKNYNYKNKGPIIKTKFRQRLWKSSSNPRFNHEYQLFKRCFPMTVFRTVSKHWLRNNSKLDLVKNIFMVSHYEKEGPQRYRQLKAYFNRWIMYAFDKFQKRMQESYRRLIWCICIRCMHSHSQGFNGYCDTTRIIPVIPREPGW